VRRWLLRLSLVAAALSVRRMFWTEIQGRSIPVARLFAGARVMFVGDLHAVSTER
jgi:hypothetical protein